MVLFLYFIVTVVISLVAVSRFRHFSIQKNYVENQNWARNPILAAQVVLLVGGLMQKGNTGFPVILHSGFSQNATHTYQSDRINL